MACRKGGVVANVGETLVGYAQRDLVMPLLSEAPAGGRPADAYTANTAAAIWCAHVNGSTHSDAPMSLQR